MQGPNTSTVRRCSAEEIPVVDIATIDVPGCADAIGHALYTASSGLGFLYVRGHGIPQQAIESASQAAYQFFRSPDAIESASQAAYQFFRSPDASKEQILISRSHRGWLKPGRARMQDDMLPDLKESFVWGIDDDGTDHRLRGRNQWPDFVPELKQASERYFNYAHQVAVKLMRGFARGLDLPEKFFLQSCDRPLSRASFVYYPPQQLQQDSAQRFGVAPHTDFGVLTVLHQDNNGGLQVQDVNGDWLEAPPIDGTLVVNVADLLSRWTAGAYKSTPHRVINTSGNERLSLVLAFDPNPETLIDARQIFSDRDCQAPIICGDYLDWRFNKAFTYDANARSA